MRPSSVRLHLTSFGPFLDVLDNPSHRIGNIVEALLQDASSSPENGCPLVLVEHFNLEVSIDAVGKYFDANPLTTSRDADSTAIELFVHLGVCRGARGEIRVESRAANDIHCPEGDFQGVKKYHEPLLDTVTQTLRSLSARCSHIETGAEGSVAVASESPQAPLRGSVAMGRAIEAIHCNIPSSALAVAVEAACSAVPNRGASTPSESKFAASMVVSQDAGRYLCNYCFCRSLAFTTCQSQLNNVAAMSVFLHVLDPDRCDGDLANPSCEDQALCIVTFLRALTMQLVSG